jgi:methionine sulfoxide reductase heme-binding subunit
VVTAVADPFAPIGVIDTFVPFAGRYRPLWLGLGAVATDLLLALVLTSLVRRRLGYPVWRFIHWTAYACWPLALVHGLGTGSDARSGWVQLLYVVCALSFLAALGWRLQSRWTMAGQRAHLTAAAGALVLTGVIAAWTVQGPIRPGWARRAGTPPALLGTHATSTSSNK